MLSNTCKYAIRATVFLSVYGSEKKKKGIKEISEKLEIPSPFLGKILQNLAKQKILSSTKGPNGGFVLARPAEEISLMDIIEIIDGKDVFDQCLVRTEHCSEDAPCSLHDSVASLRKELKTFFLDKTISDLSTEFRSDSSRIRI